jgi:DNA-binding GntR family transcriptional regulator
MAATSLAPLAVQTLADSAFERIQTAIEKGELPPGSKLSEALLARTFGISRGPLREAMRRLEGRKLVRRIPRIGPSVAVYSRKDLLEIFIIREALEGVACRLAAENMTASEMTELEAMLDQHRQGDELRSGAGYYQTPGDFDFHYRIVRGSQNSKLIELLCDELYYLIRVYRYRSGAAPGRARQAFDEHQAIVAAMRDRNSELAESLMRKHIAHARTILSVTDD